MPSRQPEEIPVEGNPPEILFNRTGIMVKPEMSAEMIHGAKNTDVGAAAGDLSLERLDYISEGIPIGSYPPIPDGDDPALAEKLAVLLDKLGERLAFERQGTRLYQTFVQKLEATSLPDDNGPSADDLRRICDQELEHFKLLQKAITHLGGDATVITPSADVAGMISRGVIEVACDPRATIAQTLQAVLMAELADNDGWRMLEHLAAELGHADLEKQCKKALQQEQEHLESVRSWLAKMTLGEALALEEGLSTQKSEPEKRERKRKPARRTGKPPAKSKSSSRKKKRK